MPIAHGDLLKTIECGLSRFLPRCPPRSPGYLNEALHYAVLLGGKRLRPMLTVLGAKVFGMEDERVLRAACAVEFIHASSLIIDDLPCMDDAELRRGNPALHRVYGEDIALLAGFALLNQAYALLGQTPESICEATECIGVNGMIGGQAIDLAPDIDAASLAERNRKTSALMRLAMIAGASACGVSRAEVAPLAAAGNCLGQAYQICDDVLDTGNHSSGKTAGQDLRHNRPSHALEFDLESCHEQAGQLIERARRSLLQAYGPREGVTGLLGFIDGMFVLRAETVPEPQRSFNARP